MGLYSNASDQNDKTLFDAILGYIKIITDQTKCDQIEVPAFHYSGNNLNKVKDIIIARDDKPLVGVRVSVNTSSIANKTDEIPLSEEEIIKASKVESDDNVATRLKKATVQSTKKIERKEYNEAIWEIHIRTKNKSDYKMFTGTPFDDDYIENAMKEIIEIVKNK